ncbi:MAG TPA: hypothetical protein VGK02_06405 [Candidatus Aquicultor sp.]|jgi:hypothetical protein
MSGHSHDDGHSEKKHKKKSIADRIKASSLAIIALTIGFLQAASTFYLREIYSLKTLMPTSPLGKADILFSKSDLLVLNKPTAARIIIDSNILQAEQARQLAIIALVIAIVYFAGKNNKERASLFLFVGGLAALSSVVFQFMLLHWPTSLLAKDVIVLFPMPVIVPIYIPLLLSALALVGGTYLVFKKG